MKRLIENQGGNAKLVTVLGILGLAYILRTGPTVFGEEMPQTLYLSIVGIVTLVTAFSLGYSLHMRLLGEKPSKHIRRELVQKTQEMEQLLVDATRRSREFEERMVEYFRGLSKKGPDCLSMVKKILRALERRLYDAKTLLATRDRIDLIAAYELMGSRLEVGGSALENLIDSEPVPALEPFEIGLSLDRLFTEIDGELQRAIEMQAQLRRVA